ncbi:UNVERIFIED_CONTAM: substrate-binding domain-containing protein [Kocuria sp. CPCC 205274]
MGNCRVPARPGEVRRLGRDPRRTPERPGAVPGAPSTEHLLSVRDLPTAALAHSDEMAPGAMRTIRRAGLRVPEDISVIGIDDHPLAELVDLTMVRRLDRDQFAPARAAQDAARPQSGVSWRSPGARGAASGA